MLMLGLDVGSVALKAVVTDADGKILDQVYRRTQGRSTEVAVAVLEELTQRWDASRFGFAAGTGSACVTICELLNWPFLNEVICQAKAVRRLLPEAQTVLEMGGQDSKLLFLPSDASDPRPLSDFAMNSNCAAGTGSFLDQQSERLGVAIEDFGQLALESKSTPTVAGRCSVFAKSDMIHLQQRATPTAEVLAGLCAGLVRNLKSTLARGVKPACPVAFCGGVAANAGVILALKEVFEFEEGELIVPEEYAITGALGAVLLGSEEQSEANANVADQKSALPNGLEFAPLKVYLSESHPTGDRLAPLDEPSTAVPEDAIPSRGELESEAKSGRIPAYLGLDVGSISTKIAVIDANGRVLAKSYQMTAGDPLVAVKRVLRTVGDQIEDLVEIRGAATTGSGRYLTGDFIGADIVINEITAQATAAAAIDPEVDTIFEIGGQDSKYIGLDSGVVVDFEMNHVCAAGTGSFLEEQAQRLGVNIKEEFGKLAMASTSPVRLGERCTVFMESDLVGYQQQQLPTEDLVAGLCYSIANNYLNRVVGNRRVGKRIFFQGGTAFNRGVLAAFEKVTGHQVSVPPNHEVTGAIGAALLALRQQHQNEATPSGFGGFKLSDTTYEVRSFLCQKCSNHCEINELRLPDRKPLFYGARCDLYDVKKKNATLDEIPDLFEERHELLLKHANLTETTEDSRPTIGIPMAMINYELLPLWGTLLDELGFRVVLSPQSTRSIIKRGVESVLTTLCFPMKVAHGHVFDLVEQGVDYVWLPSVDNMSHIDEEGDEGHLCPYIPSFPYLVHDALVHSGRTAKLLRPFVWLSKGKRGLRKELAPVFKEFCIKKKQLRAAIKKAWQAQEAFEQECIERGREVLASLTPEDNAMVLVSRPYNGCDPRVYLDLPTKLRTLGVLPIPMDFLDPEVGKLDDDPLFAKMYWRYGQRVLRVAKWLRNHPRLNAIYLSNFSCGPDSFLTNYFRRDMLPKPTLLLEIDEHSADAGMVTRLEAFLESLKNVARNASLTSEACEQPALPEQVEQPKTEQPKAHVSDRTIFVHWMGDHSHAIASAIQAFGTKAEVLPFTSEKSLEIGRRLTTGKECLPCILTAGDMVRLADERDLQPSQMAFLMPGGEGPCRFGQYCCLHQQILNDIGLGEAQIFAPTQEGDFYRDWGKLPGNFLSLAWYGVCAYNILLNALLATRPYERNRGETDEVYNEACRSIAKLLETQPSEKEIICWLEQSAETFAKIPTDRSVSKPKIGVVGEIFVRYHSFANNDLLKKLEALGAETTLAGYPEWHYYTNWVRIDDARRDRNLKDWLTTSLQDKIQRQRHHRLALPFEKVLGPLHEPTTGELLEEAKDYIHPLIQGGEAVLSVGKMAEMFNTDCHGVVNVMPFSCMPSTVTDCLMGRLSRTLGRPAISIAYDGQQDPMLMTRLSAFLYQAKAEMENS